MVESTQGAAGTGAQGTGAAAGAAGAAGAAAGAAGAQGQAQTTGQQNTGAGTAAATGQQTGTTTDQGNGTGAAAQGKPAPFVPKLPDGMKMDDAVLSEFNAIFADEKATPAERQQKVIDLQIKHAQKAEQAFRDRLAAQPAKDLESLRSDKDFGGPNYQATVDGAKRIEALAFGEDLGKLLGPLGLQSNPTIMKGLARLSRMIAEDSIGNKTGTAAESGADAEGRAMFPKSFDKMQQARRR